MPVWYCLGITTVLQPAACRLLCCSLLRHGTEEQKERFLPQVRPMASPRLHLLIVFLYLLQIAAGELRLQVPASYYPSHAFLLPSPPAGLFPPPILCLPTLSLHDIYGLLMASCAVFASGIRCVGAY